MSDQYKGGTIPKNLDPQLRQILEDHDRVLTRGIPRSNITQDLLGGGGGVGKPEGPINQISYQVSGVEGNVGTIPPQPNGSTVIFRFTGSPTLLTDSGNLHLNSDFSPLDPDETITLVSDGVGWFEISRGSSGSIGNVFVPAALWGATPHATQDRTTRIQRAFDNCPLGATLVFEPGTYLVSSDLTLSRRIHVWAYDAILNGGTNTFTTALLTLGDTSLGVGAQTQRIRVAGLKVTRTATVDVTATLLYDGIRIFNVVGGEFVDLEAENFLRGIHLVADDLGCYNNITTNYFVRHCRYGIVLEPTTDGFVNENTFIGGRHLIAGWSAVVREADFEHVRLLFAAGFTFIPNNNRFIACNFEGSAFRKLRCEGALNYFEHCRWESVKAAGFEITIGEATRAASTYGSNFLLHGNTMDFLAENVLTRIEFLNTTSIISGLIIVSHTRTYWWAGGSSVPAISVGNLSTNTALALDVIRTGTNSRSMGFRAGGSGLAGTPLGTIDWYDTSSAFHNALALDNTVFPTNRPLRVERGLLVNFGQSNNDSRVSGQTLANLTFWDASANRVGFGTDTPDRLVDIEDGTSPQLRLTHTGGSRYADLQANNDATFGGLCLLPAANASGFFAVNVFGTNEGSGLTIFDDGTDYYLRTGVARNFTVNIPSGQTARLQQNFSTYIGLDASGEASCNTPFSAATSLASDTVGKAFGVVATRSGGLPAAGFGSMMEFTLEADDGSDPGTFVVAAQWQAVWDTPSSAAPDSSTRFILRDAGTLKEIMRVAGALPGVRIENVVGGAPNALLDVRGTAIFNEDGADADWRAEGDTDPNLLFLDASADFVGIGTNTPGAKLDVRGGAIFNEAGDSVDFRVESNTLARMLFVDGANDRVGIGFGAGSPADQLHVTGNVRVTQSVRIGGDTGGVATFLSLTPAIAAPVGAVPATLGNSGGAGDPAGAAQSHWLKIYDGTTARYIPVWT